MTDQQQTEKPSHPFRPYLDGRTVQWGHWGISFMDRQPDQSKNYGIQVAYLSFPVGTRGPVDMDRKEEYRAMCKQWVDAGTLPAEATHV